LNVHTVRGAGLTLLKVTRRGWYAAKFSKTAPRIVRLTSLVQTPAAINPTENFPMFILKKPRGGVLLLSKLKSGSRSGPGFSQNFDSGSERKSRILPESTLWHSGSMATRDERTVIFCGSDPVLNFLNSVQVQPLPKKVKKLKIQFHMKSKILTKYRFLVTKTSQFFSNNSVQIRPDPKFMKQFTGRIQSKFIKIRHRPDPVQTKSSPMLISSL